ncbi:MAG TPA: hypothetical protein VJ873_05530, partial [bacterium]|nr:hypothetical protein [bacterium]
MRKNFLIFIIGLFFGVFVFDLSFAQTTSLLQDLEKTQIQNQPKGRLIDALKKYGVGKREIERFYKDLKH